MGIDSSVLSFYNEVNMGLITGTLPTIVKSKGAALKGVFDHGVRSAGRSILTTAQSFNPANMHIDGRASLLADPQRVFMFQAIILGVKEMAPKTTTLMWANDLLLRCESVSVPSLVIDFNEHEFFGAKQYTPAKRHNGGEVSITFYETEDQFITRCLYEWGQNTIQANPEYLHANHSSRVFKRTMTDGFGSNWLERDEKSDTDFKKNGYATDIIVQGFKYGGMPLPYTYKLCNCWLTGYDVPQHNSSSNEIVKYNAKFMCDYWILMGPYYSDSWDTSPMAGNDLGNWAGGQL